MVNKILGIALTGTLLLGSCASNSSTNEDTQIKIEQTMSTLDNVNEIDWKNKKNILLYSPWYTLK